MKQNKIYQACRGEAFMIICEKNKDVHPVIINVLSQDELKDQLNQLTAELYAQKFADWIQPTSLDKDFYNLSIKGEECNWIKTCNDTYDITVIGTTAQLHEKFVEENKGGGDE